MVNRSYLAAGLALAVTVAALAAAVVLIGPQRVTLTQDTSEADRVTLYQNGLAFVELHRTFHSDGDEALLVFAVPTTTIFDALVVEGDGVVVKELRSSLAASDLLEPGDTVSVRLDDGTTYAGTLLAEPREQVHVKTEAGTVLIDRADVAAIEVPGRTLGPAGPGAVEVTALVEAPAGNRTVRLSYLAQGPAWTPNYHLDVDTGAMTFFGTLTALDDWQNVRLDLVSGAPRVVATPRPTPSPYLDAREAAAAPGAGGDAAYDVSVGPSTPLGDLHRYTLERPITLARGETTRLPIAVGNATIVRHYYELDAHVSYGGVGESRDAQVLERYQLRNELSEPLPPGVVRLFQDGTWIGEDMLASTPVGEETNVTASQSREVTATTTLVDQRAQADRDTSTYELTVKNARSFSGTIDVRAKLTFSTFRTNVLSVEPEPDERAGGLVVWDTLLDQGERATFTVTYETLRNR